MCFITRLMPGDDTFKSRAAPPIVPVTMMARMTSICRSVSMDRTTLYDMAGHYRTIFCASSLRNGRSRFKYHSRLMASLARRKALDMQQRPGPAAGRARAALAAIMLCQAPVEIERPAHISERAVLVGGSEHVHKAAGFPTLLEWKRLRAYAGSC